MMSGVSYAQLLTALATIAGVIVIGLAAIGGRHKTVIEDLKSLAETRGEKIEMLKADLAEQKEGFTRQIEFLTASVEALQAQVSELQREEQKWHATELELRRTLDEMMRPRRTKSQ